MKIGIISLGCSKNLVDTENLIGVLQHSNQEITYNLNEAEAIFINTCGFIDDAKEEAINTILEMSEYKQKNCKKLVVMGCLSERYYDSLVEEFPEVDCFLPIKKYKQLGPILTDVLGVTIVNSYGKSPQVLTGKPWLAYLKIADGCNNRCSYCAIPLIRGNYTSYPIEDLIENAKSLAEKGVKELNIVAQDTTCYGKDLYGKRRLLDLLCELNKIDELKWIRVLYMYPDEIDDELLYGMSKLNKVLPYFDIPLQHGVDRVLKSMNRRGSTTSILNKINKIREIFKRPVLRTTIIVGFPGESDEDFEGCLKFISLSKWNRLGSFAYSKEEDTAAYNFDNEVSNEVKEERLKKLMDLQNEISQKVNEVVVGEILEVVTEKKDGLTGFYYGRSVYNAPDGIDGSVIFKSDRVLNYGEFCKVRINRVKNHNFYGEIVG
ncbi:MAG: 30S ribosomal protein S12 methylthiotransferase RimO [Anaerorhabdus sp.]